MLNSLTITTMPRIVKVKLKVNTISMESENGIFLFIPFAPEHPR